MIAPPHEESAGVSTGGKAHPALWIAFCGTLAGLILAFDISMPLGVAGGVPYVALVLVGLFLPAERAVLLLATVGTALTVFGYFLSAPASQPWIVFTNRGLAMFAIWTTAVMVLRFRMAQAALRRSEGRLSAILAHVPETIHLKDADGRRRR
jgi:hypothetical protein